MTRRACIKCFIVVIKWTFTISLTFAAILISITASSGNSSNQANSSAAENFQTELQFNHDTAGSSSNKLCGDLSFPSSKVAKESWQPVDKSRSMYTFSAYFVADSSTVFVIGVRPRNHVSVICQFWQQKEGKTAEIVDESEADVRALLDDFGYRFAPTIFECFVDSPTPPIYVSLVTKHCDSPTNILKVQTATKESPSYERHLTVCLQPLVYKYDKSADFIKWLEINRQFGVDKFVVYNYSSGSNIGHVLDHYSERGITEVVQWRPPMVNENLPQEIQPVELENYGQTVALNDCLYRNKKTSEFITNIGVNEYITSPTNNESTIRDMVNSLGIKAAVYQVSKFILKKKFSKPNPKPNPQNTVQKAKPKPVVEKPKTNEENLKLNVEKPKHGIGNKKLISQKVKTKVSPVNTKLIIRTSEVEFSSMHHVPGVKSYVVPSEKALMHKHPGFGPNRTFEPGIANVLSRKVINRANQNVQKVWSNLENVHIK